jgi:hypothetical protein
MAPWAQAAAAAHAHGVCATCGIPLDARYFDNSSVTRAPDPGRELVLASFDLPAEYCGVLEYFAQFTTRHARDPSAIETPDLEWTLRLNGRPMDPYLGLRWIVNFWGYGGFPLAIRLDESSRLELVVRGTTDSVAADRVDRQEAPMGVGGRLLGRYWYNPAYGAVARRRS